MPSAAGFSTCVRGAKGISLNHGQCITTFILERYLPLVDGLDETATRKLLYPDDPQDVLRAIELLSAIVAVAKINPTLPPFTPLGSMPDVNIVADFEALSVLGGTLENLLKPLINIKLSLSQQIVHLSCFAHLLFTFYHDQRRRFVPNQLYYDSQTMVKNVVFCIAKQQKLNLSSSLSLLDVGDNALELTFALMRMSGGHNNAFNYRQVIDRLCAVCDISDIYSRNPNIRHGHRRLNMNQKESVDHISRATWVGNMTAGNCDLLSCWLQGRQKALKILRTSKIPPASYHFDSIFASGSGIDMLCVFGDEKYPSIDDAKEHEDLIDHLVRPLTAERTAEDTPLGSTSSGIQSETNGAGPGDDDELDIGFDEAVEDELNALDHPTPTSTPHSVADALSSIAPPSGPGVCANDYLWCNERKWVHKQSVCHLIITPDFSPKSTV